MTGVAVAGALTDPGEVLLELPNAVASAPSFLLKINGLSKTKIWLITAGVGSEVETEEINAFGHESTLTGTALISLASGKNWSPLL